MGVGLGLAFGVGVLLIWHALTTPAQDTTVRRGPRTYDRLAQTIAAADLEAVTPARLLLTCAGAGFVTTLAVVVSSRTWSVAVAFGVLAGLSPVSLVRYRVRRRRAELRELWPDAIDNLASAVRAGLGLPEALTQLGTRGPAPLRRPFEQFGDDYRATGGFNDCLDRLKARLADPTGDRIVEALRIARDVGGRDLGHLLRTLSGFLRDEARTRAELETRQSWIVNAARLAVAAPWILLALLSMRTPAVRAFDSPGGVIVLTIGAATCVVAYRLMLRLGRLPEEHRVLS